MFYKTMTRDKYEWVLTEPHWRDIHGTAFVEAICEHGIGHHNGIHGCDGCCIECPMHLWEKVSKD